MRDDDPQDQAEALDDDTLGGEGNLATFPPHRAVAVDGYGTTDNEQRMGESLEQALGREEPDAPEGTAAADAAAEQVLLEDVADADHP